MTEQNKPAATTTPPGQAAVKGESGSCGSSPAGPAEARMDNEGGGHGKPTDERTHASASQRSTPSSPADRAGSHEKTSRPGDTRSHESASPRASSHEASGDKPSRLDPAAETEYWRGAFASRPYGKSGQSYEEFAPAYRLGWESAGHSENATTFDSVEKKIGSGWDQARGTSRLGWDQAKHAARDAWDRARKSIHSATAPAGKQEVK